MPFGAFPQHARRLFQNLAIIMGRAERSLRPTAASTHWSTDASLRFVGHQDHEVVFTTAGPSRTTLKFLWRPYLDNVTNVLETTLFPAAETQGATPQPSQRGSIIVVSAGQWDLLHTSPRDFNAAAARLADAIAHAPRVRATASRRAAASTPPAAAVERRAAAQVWCHANSLRGIAVASLPRTVPVMLRDENKVVHMAPQVVNDANNVLTRVMPTTRCVFPIDMHAVREPDVGVSCGVVVLPPGWGTYVMPGVAALQITAGREDFAADGVHYTEQEYGTGVQVLLNAFRRASRGMAQLLHPPTSVG